MFRRALLPGLVLAASLGCNAIIGVDPGKPRDAGVGGSSGAACRTVADCPAAAACGGAVCIDGRCGTSAAAPGSPCLDDAGNGAVCDGAGQCVACVANVGCAAKDPSKPICDPATHACVSCNDGIKNGRETAAAPIAAAASARPATRCMDAATGPSAQCPRTCAARPRAIVEVGLGAIRVSGSW